MTEMEKEWEGVGRVENMTNGWRRNGEEVEEGIGKGWEKDREGMGKEWGRDRKGMGNGKGNGLIGDEEGQEKKIKEL